MNTFDFEYQLADELREAKLIKKELICPIHKRKVLITGDYLNDGTYVYITKYCCLEHAKVVAAAFINAKIFDHIRIKYHDAGPDFVTRNEYFEVLVNTPSH